MSKKHGWSNIILTKWAYFGENCIFKRYYVWDIHLLYISSRMGNGKNWQIWTMDLYQCPILYRWAIRVVERWKQYYEMWRGMTNVASHFHHRNEWSKPGYHHSVFMLLARRKIIKFLNVAFVITGIQLKEK